MGNSTSGSILQTQGTGGPATGTAFDISTDGTTDSLSAATRIVKIWLPGKKFTKTGVLKYENNSPQVKFFDYTCYT
jgi:hypothetical protein